MGPPSLLSTQQVSSRQAIEAELLRQLLLLVGPAWEAVERESECIWHAPALLRAPQLLLLLSSLPDQPTTLACNNLPAQGPAAHAVCPIMLPDRNHTVLQQSCSPLQLPSTPLTKTVPPGAACRSVPAQLQARHQQVAAAGWPLRGGTPVCGQR